MKSIASWLVLLATALAVAAGPALAYWPHDPTVNVPICTAANAQTEQQVCSDGAGGAILAWMDFRSGTNYDIYAQRVNAAGTVQWTANGVVICNATGTQHVPQIVSDGAGGAIVVWQDGRSGGTYDVYAQRVNNLGAVQWTANGVVICNATNLQERPGIVADGAGGAIITWQDVRSGATYDIYAQRVNAAGTVQWTANGVAICTAAGNQEPPAIVSDDAGGAIMVWQDGRATWDIYAQRVNDLGAVQWTANGVALSTATGEQASPSVIADGSGGAIASWDDTRSGGYDIYAQHVLESGAVDPAWVVNGRAVCTATGNQNVARLCPDGAGGAIVAWWDGRGATTDIYAQRVDAYARLGVEPAITSARDISNDQGGYVHLVWKASLLDVMPTFEIGAYHVWRQVSVAAAQEGVAAGGRLLDEGEVVGEASGPLYRRIGAGPDALYWEYLGAVTAVGLADYAFPAPTLQDSLPDSNLPTTFMVDAQKGTGAVFYSSLPYAGYSVDNLGSEL
jgi:hypothetical protein